MKKQSNINPNKDSKPNPPPNPPKLDYFELEQKQMMTFSEEKKPHKGWCKWRHCVHNLRCTKQEWYFKHCVEKRLDDLKCKMFEGRK